MSPKPSLPNALLAVGVVLWTKCFPDRLAPSSLLGVLPDMRRHRNCSAPSRSLGTLLATVRPPTYSMPPLLLRHSSHMFALLAARRPRGARRRLSFSSPFWRLGPLSVPNPGRGHTALSGCSALSPLAGKRIPDCSVPSWVFGTYFAFRRPPDHAALFMA